MKAIFLFSVIIASCVLLLCPPVFNLLLLFLGLSSWFLALLSSSFPAFCTFFLLICLLHFFMDSQHDLFRIYHVISTYIHIVYVTTTFFLRKGLKKKTASLKNFQSRRRLFFYYIKFSVPKITSILPLRNRRKRSTSESISQRASWYMSSSL